MLTLFGIPYYQTSIDPNSYDKENIVSTIKDNYKIDSNRNHYDDVSDFHNSYNDWENNTFVKPNFEKLIPIYTQQIQNFFDSLITCSSEVSFVYEIVNYTCMGVNQFMNQHLHPSDFVAVHYISFPKGSQPTTFHNLNDYAKYINPFLPIKHLKKLYSNSDINQSWLHEAWNPETNEDDFIITPGLLTHSVNKNNSTDLRITIILNIAVVIKEKV